MADNTTLNSGSGGDVIATDDIAGVKHQRVKVEYGADGSATDVSAAAPLPVEISDGTDTALIDGSGNLNVAVADGANIEGMAAENAAASGNPVLSGGRYDATARSLDDGDAGAIALDPNGAVLVSSHTLQSPTSGGNSSTTPLGISATFTGTGEQNEHPDVGVSCKTDQTGTLYFDFSNDGTNWDTFPTAGFAIAADVHEFHTAVKLGRYFRVRLVNDATAQTYLRLYTYYGTFAGKPNAPIGQSINDDSDATTVKAVIVGDSGSGYVNVGVTSGGNFKVDVEDISGTAVSVNAGNADAGTQRVVLASDQPVISIDDNAGSITVDGTVTANLSATDNAVLDNIDTNTTDIPNVIGTDGAAGPSKAVSIGGTDGSGNLQEITTDTDGHLQVDVLSGGGGGTQYTEDDAAAANPVGTQPVMIRQDTPASEVSLNGDVIAQRATAYGAAYTQIVDSSGNFVDTFGGSGGTSAADDADFTAGTTQGTPAMGVYESSPTSVTDGDLGTVGIDVNRQMKTVEANSAAILADTANMDTNLGTIAGDTTSIDSKITACNTGAVVVSSGTITADLGANNDVTIDGSASIGTDGAAHGASQTGMRAMGTDGTNDQQIAVDASGNVQVDIVADAAGLATAANQLPDGHNVTVDNAAGASAVNIQDGGNSITVDTAGGALDVSGATVTVDLGANNDVQGDVAHDATDSGNPMKVGMKALSHGTNPTEVANNDRTDWYANLAGVPFVIGGHPNVKTFRANYTTAQTDTAIVSTTEKIVVTRVSVTADNANTVDVQARVGFGATTTPTGAGVLLSHPGIAAGSGVIEGNGSGMLGVGAAGEDVRITSEAPTTGSIDVVVSYYEISS